MSFSFAQLFLKIKCRNFQQKRLKKEERKEVQEWDGKRFSVQETERNQTEPF